ncbi:MAG: hypothetical protein KDI07_15040 [Anaerolineae bacterium]|nr:hypothetical protein [Anaerolineae bacterium]MCB0242878.1 hypothetical protein [Anaerolineae bacterium]MCB0249889.1 hypothetical protein [Anaerolineae bacterium]MCB9130176.1 hypothetical protein [Anaerolineales bacterium]MCO5243023.1 hypothetical protein [Anaerolineae bacterium]
MTVASYRQVLKLAQQLPFNSQLELAEALLGNVRMTLNPLSETEAAVNLSPLLGMSESELEALAEAVVAPERQQQIEDLLALNREGMLTVEQGATLDHLIAEVDQVALLKARALYTLQLTREQSRGN